MPSSCKDRGPHVSYTFQPLLSLGLLVQDNRFECILHLPAPVDLVPSSCRDTGLSASYTFQPLSNLVYTRDQQVTTCKGIVMGRLRSSQRQLEVEVMRFCFEKLGESAL